MPQAIVGQPLLYFDGIYLGASIISSAYEAAVGRTTEGRPKAKQREGSSYYSTAEDVHSFCQLPHPDEIFRQIRS